MYLLVGYCLCGANVALKNINSGFLKTIVFLLACKVHECCVLYINDSLMEPDWEKRV